MVTKEEWLFLEQLISFLNLDQTFWLQLGIFIFVFVALKALVFNPMLGVFEERSARIAGDQRWAVELNEKAKQDEDRYAAELSAERHVAKTKFEESLRAAKSAEQLTVQEARKTADAEVELQKKKLIEEKQKAMRSLEADVEGLSLVIADRLTRRVG